MSYTDRFCLRNAITFSRSRCVLVAGRATIVARLRSGKKNSRWGSARKWWHSTRKLPGVYPKRSATSLDGCLSTK